MNRLKKQLLNLAIGEFAALCTFILVYRLLNLGTGSLIAFSFLVFILFQGSLYWFYRYVLTIRKKSFGSKAIEGFKALRLLNMILIVGIGIRNVMIRSDPKDFIFATGFLLFGIIEYINYYWYRLSYGKSGFNLKILWNTKLKKSSIHKIIQKKDRDMH